MTTTRGHVLIVTETADHAPDEPAYAFSVECLNVKTCGGWTECTHPDGHRIDGDVEREDAEDAGIHTFHGGEHQYHYGYDWAVPFDGCVVQAALSQWCSDSAEDIAHEYGLGRHHVEDEWDDGNVYLHHLRTEETAR